MPSKIFCGTIITHTFFATSLFPKYGFVVFELRHGLFFHLWKKKNCRF
jgi:hypothetical protein